MTKSHGLLFYSIHGATFGESQNSRDHNHNIMSNGANGTNQYVTHLMPIILSTLAGLSTCLGAAVVFCVDRPRNGKQHQRRRLGHREMCFSLSLAGSVMITVSVASIIPESLTDDSDSSKLISIQSADFLQRLFFFSAGAILFLILSKCAFPEPNEILGFEESNDIYLNGNNDDSKSPTSINVNDKVTYRRNSKVTSSNNDSKYPLQSVIGSHARKRSTSSTCQQHDDDENVEISEASLPLDNNEVGETRLLISENLAIEHQQNQVFQNSLLSFTMSGGDLQSTEARRAWRVTMLLFVSLAVHNFPEGLAVGASTIYNIRLGWTTAVAIALHNIPEGIAIAVPCLAAR